MRGRVTDQAGDRATNGMSLSGIGMASLDARWSIWDSVMIWLSAVGSQLPASGCARLLTRTVDLRLPTVSYGPMTVMSLASQFGAG